MKTKVGLFGIGLDTYWAQFDGLLDHLKAYQEEIKNRLSAFGVEVANANIHNALSCHDFSPEKKVKLKRE